MESTTEHELDTIRQQIRGLRKEVRSLARSARNSLRLRQLRDRVSDGVSVGAENVRHGLHKAGQYGRRVGHGVVHHPVKAALAGLSLGAFVTGAVIGSRRMRH